MAINLGLAVLALPMLALTFVAFLNGDIAPNPEVAKVAADRWVCNHGAPRCIVVARASVTLALPACSSLPLATSR